MANTRDKSRSAKKGRRAAFKDPTKGIKWDAYQDSLEFQKKQSDISLIGGIAKGVGTIAGQVESNMSSHEAVEKGVERLTSEQSINIDNIDYEAPSILAKMTSQADPSASVNIGGKTFNFEELKKIGTPKTAKGAEALRLFDEDANDGKGGYKSLYDSYGKTLDEASTPKPLDITDMQLNPLENKVVQPNESSSVIKNTITEIQKENKISQNNNDVNMKWKAPSDSSQGTDPMKDETYIQYRNRLRNMDLNPSDFSYMQYDKMK